MPVKLKIKDIEKKINDESPDDTKNRIDSMDRNKQYLHDVLILIVGGPVSGKTTLLSNITNLMKRNGENIDSMIKIGSKIMSAIDSEQPISIGNALNQGKPILIDNHGIKNNEIEFIINIAKKYKYRTVMIHPHIDKQTFLKRVEIRRNEIGREYDIDLYWTKHLLFAKNLHHFMTNNCPFDTLIIYDNIDDAAKKLIYVKHKENSYIFNKEGYQNIIDKHNECFPNCDINKIIVNKVNKFINKEQYLTSDLINTLNTLFIDIYHPESNEFVKYLDSY